MDQHTIDTYNKIAQEYDDETVGFWSTVMIRVVQRFSKY